MSDFVLRQDPVYSETHFMRIVGKTQKEMLGTSDVEEYEGWHPVAGLEFGVECPMDGHSKRGRGRHQYRSVIVATQLVSALPELHQAIVAAEELTIEIHLCRHVDAGGLEPWGKLKFLKAHCTEIGSGMNAESDHDPFEVLHFEFGEIEVLTEQTSDSRGRTANFFDDQKDLRVS